MYFPYAASIIRHMIIVNTTHALAQNMVGGVEISTSSGLCRRD
jgi:hypothetical protein